MKKLTSLVLILFALATVSANAGVVQFLTTLMGWNIKNTAYNSVSFSDIATCTGASRGMAFSNDGTKMYIQCALSPVTIFQYTLSTPWNVSTATYSSLSVTTGTTISPVGISISSNGLYFYFVDNNSATINQWTMSTPNNISTATATTTFLTTTQSVNNHGVAFSADGTKMYVAGNATSQTIYEYTLSTPFLISSATFTTSLSISANVTNAYSLWIDPSGVRLYVASLGGPAVYEYLLSTPGNVSTGVFYGSFSIATQVVNYSRALWLNPSIGNFMYVVDTVVGTVYQYTVGP